MNSNKTTIDKIRKIADNAKINPDIIIDKVIINNKEINIIQEGYLLTGAKQRAATIILTNELLYNPKIKITLYVAMYNGFGALALAFAAYKLKIKCIVCICYLSDINLVSYKKSKQYLTLCALNAQVLLYKNWFDASDAGYKIYNKHKKYHTCFYPVMGFTSIINVQILAKQFMLANKGAIKNNATIWLVSGSGGLAQALSIAFPQAHIGIFMTGGNKYKDNVREWARHKTNVKLIENLDFLPDVHNDVYDTVYNYDDYIYKYVYYFAVSGDYIFNTASDTFLEKK